ncbi:hypothetical protein E2C01_033129 [Portunus trituberculatus]|uniref:Uncharacterized protein n=1 Tax=Portunus trituberculatus TaxID=210409 RepID=A0A5B7F358_PORTR|nr:hypothetical protein [Portunus trituberculatus]
MHQRHLTDRTDSSCTLYTLQDTTPLSPSSNNGIPTAVQEAGIAARWLRRLTTRGACRVIELYRASSHPHLALSTLPVGEHVRSSAFSTARGGDGDSSDRTKRGDKKKIINDASKITAGSANSQPASQPPLLVALHLITGVRDKR